MKRSAVPSSSLTLPYLTYLRQRPLPFFLWFALRRLKYRMLGIPVRQLSSAKASEGGHLEENVIPYNRGLVGSISRDRTERLMNVFRSMQGVDLRTLRVLCVGPRNEAEILLLSLYGFRIDQITAIDLFSYSPHVQLMDMHHLEFPDGTFDVVYMSYVLTYSDDVPAACHESLRVLKDGGLIALSFQRFLGSGTNRFGRNVLQGGLKQLFGYFEGHIRHVYWQEEFEQADSVICSTIFRVSKSGTGQGEVWQAAEVTAAASVRRG